MIWVTPRSRIAFAASAARRCWGIVKGVVPMISDAVVEFEVEPDSRARRRSPSVIMPTIEVESMTTVAP